MKVKLKFLSNKKGFLGIDNKFNFKEKVIVIPFGLEKTVSYGGGTKNGPKDIIKASHQVELYDEELNCEPYKKIGIKTLKPFKIDRNINKALKKIAILNKEIINKKLFPMTFGGEHSITPGCIGPFVKKYKKGTAVKLLVQPDDLEHDDKSKLKLEIIDRKFRGTNFIYTIKTTNDDLIPVFVHSHHIHQHEVEEKFGVKTPIYIDHLVCF